jgi:hypothetical protein
MAIYRNALLKFAGVDVTTQLRSLAANESAEEQDDTAMGDTTRSSAGGLLRWTIEGEANQSFGTTTQLDVAFATRVGTTQTVVWRPFASATSLAATNPKYSGTGLLTEYVPMSGSVGDQFIATFSIVSAGTRTRTIST